MRQVVTLIVAFGILACGRLAIAQPSPKPVFIAQTPRSYASPSAAFDAYRDAISKGDTQTQFYCQVPEVRIDVYQAFLGGGMALAIRPEMAPAVTAVLKKFDVEMSTVMAEYGKQYKAKHGVDPEKQAQEHREKRRKALADYEKTHGKDPHGPIPDAVLELVGPAPQVDDELLREVINAKVVQKDEFVIAMMAATRNHQNPELPPGPLKNLEVKGDTATGETSHTVVSYGGPEGVGKPEGKVTRDVSGPVRFRKTKDGWLIAGFNTESGTTAPPRRSQ